MITPLPYQTPIVAAIQRSLRAGKPHLETSDTGTGKTFMALLAAREISQHIRVICPISVQTAWLEAAEATGASLEFVANIEALKPSRFLVAHTTTRRGRDGQDKKTTTYTWTQPIPDDAVLILDEAHRFFSSDSSQAAAIAWSWAPRPAILLSATPFDTILKTKAVHVLFRLTTPSAWWVYVQRKYRASRGFFGGLQISRQRDTEALASLREALGPHMTGLRKADLVQYFPPVIIHTRTLPVDNPEQLESLYVQDLERLRDETDVAAVEFLRSRQIAEAMMAPLVSELMDDYAAQGNTVLAFVNFKATLKVLPAQAVFHGELSKEEKDAFVSGVQANRVTKGALTLDAGGESITLDDQTGSNPRVLFVIAGVTARAIIQAIGRGNRAKSKSPLTVFILFPDCPSGRRIRRIVDAKKTNLETILDSELL